MHRTGVYGLLSLCHVLTGQSSPVPGSFTIPLHKDHELAARDVDRWVDIPLTDEAQNAFDEQAVEDYQVSESDGVDLDEVLEVEDEYADISLDDEVHWLNAGGTSSDDSDDEAARDTWPTWPQWIEGSQQPTTGNKDRIANSKMKALDLKANGLPLYYYTSIKAGKSNKYIDVVVDTASSLLILPGPDCGAANGCMGQNKYDNSGDDQKTPARLGYASGVTGVEGDMYTDQVSFGRLKDSDMDIFSVSKNRGRGALQHSLGVLGLGIRPDIAGGTKQVPQTINGRTNILQRPSFFERLVRNDQLDRPLFACYLGREKAKTVASSEITFGAVNTRRTFGSIVTIDVADEGTNGWTIPTSAVNVNSRPISDIEGNTLPAQIDTGSAFITGPKGAVDALFSAVPGVIPIQAPGSTSRTYYAMPCGNPPTIGFVFNKFEFRIHPDDLFFDKVNSAGQRPVEKSWWSNAFPSDKGNASPPVVWTGSALSRIDREQSRTYCVASIVGSTELNSKIDRKKWTLGAAFLRNWYSIFTFEKTGATIGFAAAQSNNPGQPVRVAAGGLPLGGQTVQTS